MDGRKRLSGAEYRKLAKEKRKKESDVLSQTPKLEAFFKKPNVNEDEGSREKSDVTEVKEEAMQPDTLSEKITATGVNEDEMASHPGTSTNLQEISILYDAEAEEKGTQHDEVCKKLSPTGVANEDESLSCPDPSTNLQEISILYDAEAEEKGTQHDELCKKLSPTGVVNEDELLLSCPDPSTGLQETSEFPFDFRDPGSWPQSFSDSERCYIVKMRTENLIEPNISNSSREGRNLTKDWFYKVLKNESKVKRSWLCYSESNKALYCVPCRLFSHLVLHQASSLAKEKGLTNWKKLSEKLPEHENSSNHKLCFCSWKALESCLGKGGIDAELQNQIHQEESHWKAVLRCIIDAILFLAKQGSPFRGTKEDCDFSNPSSGKFLNTIDLISHYSVPLQQHIERHKKGQISYFSHKIQDEFLEIIANNIRRKIIQDILNAKYFSLIFDCTPDISHSEQMTQVVRYVKTNTSEVEESFIDFFPVSDKTGEGLSQEILKKLDKDGLNLENCRGQSYDNGANMAGKYKGVQSRLLQENELAYFVPCAAHSLNLVGANAASATIEAQNFFGTLNSMYSFFVASTSRWEVLRKYVPLTLKPESKTRWSARLEAVEAVYKHYGKVLQALKDLKKNDLSTPQTKSEARSLLKNIGKLEFIVLACFWHALLKKINHVNEFLQRKDLTVDLAARNLQGLLTFLKSCREFAPSEAITEGKFLASINDLPSMYEFSEKRQRKKKKMPDELCGDEAPTSAENVYQVAMLEVIDRMITELSDRFKALDNINNKFGFLNGVRIKEMQVKDLKMKAEELANIYTADLNNEEFKFEIESFKHHALSVDDKLKEATSREMLSLIYKNKLEEGYPNITTALRMFLTLPVTVSSGERSFSKLKIIKNYMRSTMGQERLSNLSIISIEHKRASLINFDDIVSTFAAKKARRI